MNHSSSTRLNLVAGYFEILGVVNLVMILSVIGFLILKDPTIERGLRTHPFGLALLVFLFPLGALLLREPVSGSRCR